MLDRPGRVTLTQAIPSLISGGNTGWLPAGAAGTLVEGTDDAGKATVLFDWAYMRDPNTGHYFAMPSVVVVVLRASLEAA